ncbi:MAG: hypothetical protein IKP34_06150 [Bacteroidales bacterium]|nr:hypothetical protein [Bacteroidales bacterium]
MIIKAIQDTLKQKTTVVRTSPFLQKGVSFHDFLSTKHPDKSQFQSKFDETLFNSEFDQIKKEFQEHLKEQLSLLPGSHAETEYKFFMDTKDSADIWVDMGKYEVIIEIDAARADQAGKKMLSRYSYSCHLNNIKKNVVYVSLLYQGTKAMNKNECMKYFQMGYDILTKINSKNVFIEYIIDKQDKEFTPYDVKTYKALDTQLYKAYLQGGKIKSINSYMKPLNRVHSLSLYPRDAQKKLIQYNNQKTSITIDDFLKKKGIIIDKKDRSYWKRYCEYLKWQKNNGNPLGIE